MKDFCGKKYPYGYGEKRKEIRSERAQLLSHIKKIGANYVHCGMIHEVGLSVK